MERAVSMTVMFLIMILVVSLITIYLYKFAQSGESAIQQGTSRIKVTIETSADSIEKSQIAKISITGNFSISNKVVINVPKLLKQTPKSNKIVKVYGYPQFEVNLVPVTIDGVMRVVVYAVIYKNGEAVYSTAGDEITYVKDSFWITMVEFTCYNEKGEKVGVTLLSGSICGEIGADEKCFYRVTILLHNPTQSLIEIAEPELPTPPHGIKPK